MTFQRKLLLGFGLMTLPVLLVGAEAIRSNAQERRALEVLGERMQRSRTYAELETAMQAQVEVVWRHLTGLDPTARREFVLAGDVVRYWRGRWAAELGPEERPLTGRLDALHGEVERVADSVFALADAGRRPAAYALAEAELRGRILPALTAVNRETYRELRQSSVRGAYVRLEEIIADVRRNLVLIVALALGLGVLASWFIARSLARPVQALATAMDEVGAGRLDGQPGPRPPATADEIGRLTTAFAAMRANLREAQARLVQSEKLASIGEMAAAVAHGLRNPLAGLRASAQLALRQSPGSPAARESLAAIVDEADRLDRRITHLLSFARPAPYHPVPDSVPGLVGSVLPGFSALLAERQVTVATDFPPDLPDVLADPLQVEQVLVELISNAVEAMPAGGRLAVRARAADGEVCLEVADTGVGIAPETLPAVCDPFFTTRPEGTGLGLAIARRYAEQNGGRLELESRVGAGTVVRLTLPAAAGVPVA